MILRSMEMNVLSARESVSTNKKKKYYKNRVRCVCGLYTSEANPKWKHEKTNSHMNYMKYGTRNPDGYAYISRNGTPEQRFKIEYALMKSEEEEKKIAK